MSVSWFNDLITLGQFEGGWGWEGQLRAYIKQKYRTALAGLQDLSPNRLALCLGAELIPEKPYATIAWILRLRPFRPLELYFFYNLDPEFGFDLRVYFGRTSRRLPTEDAYVFAWDFLALLARYGRRELPLTLAPSGGDWLPLAALVPPGEADSWQRFLLQDKLAVAARVEAAVATAAVWRLDRGQCLATPEGWEISWPILPDLVLQLKKAGPTVEVAYEAGGAVKYPAELLGSFAWLHLNALLREARQVDPSLPQLSGYF